MNIVKMKEKNLTKVNVGTISWMRYRNYRNRLVVIVTLPTQTSDSHLSDGNHREWWYHAYAPVKDEKRVRRTCSASTYSSDFSFTPKFKLCKYDWRAVVFWEKASLLKFTCGKSWILTLWSKRCNTWNPLKNKQHKKNERNGCFARTFIHFQ